jgi:uncharacterized protein with von Willebrand factor type A (vWA) domain
MVWLHKVVLMAEKKKRLKDLTPVQREYIEAYVRGICSWLAKGPAGESPEKYEKEYKACIDMMYEDEEKLVDMAEAWLKGIIKVVAPPKEVYALYDRMMEKERQVKGEWRRPPESAYDYYWRYRVKPAEPPEWIPMRGMRRIPSPEEARREEEARRKRIEELRKSIREL